MTAASQTTYSPIARLNTTNEQSTDDCINISEIAKTGEISGYFGRFGGKYVAETLRPALDQLDQAFRRCQTDPDFQAELYNIQKTWIGRPTPLLYAENVTKALGGAKVYVKMEGLAHTGAHKINNALGQALLAKRLGKTRIIAETGAGQHGLATAAVCAKLGLSCVIYMGAVDVARQYPNVFAMQMYGAEVVTVESGAKTLKDAVDAALIDYAESYQNTHYLIGSALGPAPFPAMVRYFQSVIGKETYQQLDERGISPDVCVACVGGGSNAIGFFSPYLPNLAETTGTDHTQVNKKIRLIGVEAGGRDDTPGQHAARMSGQGQLSIAQGYKSMFILDADGEIGPTHSISAGLDYCGIGPELAHHGETGRIEFTQARDNEALDALQFFARHEGVIFALESAHAAAVAMKIAPTLGSDQVVVVNMSGRGDKDLFITAREFGQENWVNFLQAEAER